MIGIGVGLKILTKGKSSQAGLRFSQKNTALDLVRYSKRLGGLSQIATVLMELSEKLTADSILQAAKREKELSCSQRLGYILEKIGKKNLTVKLKKWIMGQKTNFVILDPSKECKRFTKKLDWNVIVNEKVESEV